MKKTLTLNLTEKEYEALAALSDSLELSKTATLKLSLRMYQNIHSQTLKGWRLDFVDQEGRSHNQLLAQAFIGSMSKPAS